jgi:hypothetical protein
VKKRAEEMLARTKGHVWMRGLIAVVYAEHQLRVGGIPP